MGKKRDIKQFQDACRIAGLTDEQLKRVGKAFHQWKTATGSRDLAFAELLAWMQEWKAEA